MRNKVFPVPVLMTIRNAVVFGLFGDGYSYAYASPGSIIAHSRALSALISATLRSSEELTSTSNIKTGEVILTDDSILLAFRSSSYGTWKVPVTLVPGAMTAVKLIGLQDRNPHGAN